MGNIPTWWYYTLLHKPQSKTYNKKVKFFSFDSVKDTTHKDDDYDLISVNNTIIFSVIFKFKHNL